MAALGTAQSTWSQDQTIHIAQGNGKSLDNVDSPLTTFHSPEVRQESVSADNLPKGGQRAQTQSADILPFRLPLKDRESPALVVSSQSAIDPVSQSIIRAHFANTILSDLNRLQQYSGQPNAASYANKLFRIIRQYRDLSPAEPYVEILEALYDSMAFQNRWIEYSAAQYGFAAKVLRSYAGQKLDNSKVGKAILKLQGAGFDTIPFGESEEDISLDDEEES